MSLIYIALGSAIGGCSRFLLGGLVQRQLTTTFPFGTIAVNITGCLVLGMINGWAAYRGAVSHEMRLLLVTGFCGGFTTFSAFTLETVALAKGGEIFRAGLNVLISVALCLLGFLIGDRLMRG